jgi:hypothetical protein
MIKSLVRDSNERIIDTIYSSDVWKTTFDFDLVTRYCPSTKTWYLVELYYLCVVGHGFFEENHCQAMICQTCYCTYLLNHFS